DLSMRVVIIGCLAIIVVIMAVPQLHLRGNLLGAFLIVLFGFLFVTVSSRLTGEIGSSSNPISGMTVATLLLTCLIFLVIGWTGPSYYITALSIGGIVCIASSNGGTTSQDLKTGFLVGSTPKYQQIAILVGAFASALIQTRRRGSQSADISALTRRGIRFSSPAKWCLRSKKQCRQFRRSRGR